MLKLCKITACPNGTLGLHLSRAPWDPYPWVSGVQEGSSAFRAGVRIGDTVLELNGADVLGQKISDLATKIRCHWDDGGNFVNFLIWRNKNEQNSINQQSLQRFATCLQNIAQLLECPVCLEVVKPPGWQCCNGHVLCNSCRGRTVKCPICRVTLGPRGRCLLSDKLFTLLAETFPCDVKKQDADGRCPEHKTTSPSTKITSPKSPKDNKQIISIKVDFKSPPPEEPPYHHHHHGGVPHKNYHCPTGKSCASSGQEKDESCGLHSQWDVLTHLRRDHHLSVVQHYGTYGERMQVEFMNKSISCISIASVRLLGTASVTPLNGLQASPNPAAQVMAGATVHHHHKPHATTGIEKGQRVELFFVARIPIALSGSDVAVQDEEQEQDTTIPGGNERCAIFIWYCGPESDVKKFRAVIECKETGTKWTGCIHPMTKSWKLVQRQKEFVQISLAEAKFCEIVIKAK